MSNFKSGSGNLDFGSDNEEDKTDETATETTETQAKGEESESTSAEQSTSAAPEKSESHTENAADQPTSERVSVGEPADSAPSADVYPYFVRRSNVGDERDTRLEIHVRDKVADQEAEFRSDLAEQLGTTEVSKTDAREFALLAAFQHPARVAELMRDEGFDVLD